MCSVRVRHRGVFVAAASALLASLGANRDASAEIVASFSVGSGTSSSLVQFDFTNGNGYLIELLHNGGVTGFDALLAFDAWLPEFTLVYKDFGFGELVAGIGILGDFEYGMGDQWPVVENYWHYWLQDSGSWEFAQVGASSRTLFDGSFDGWVFGSPQAPQVIPAPAGIFLGFGSLASLLRRRRNS